MTEKIKYGLIVVIIFLGIISYLTPQANEIGDFNVEGINSGSLQFQGVTWCKKYFDYCVWTEKWIGPILQDRQVVSPEQFVTIQTGITNPEVNEFEEDGNGLYRIRFTYDQRQPHERWVIDEK
jgi:hypothetical protein